MLIKVLMFRTMELTFLKLEDLVGISGSAWVPRFHEALHTIASDDSRRVMLLWHIHGLKVLGICLDVSLPLDLVGSRCLISLLVDLRLSFNESQLITGEDVRAHLAWGCVTLLHSVTLKVLTVSLLHSLREIVMLNQGSLARVLGPCVASVDTTFMVLVLVFIDRRSWELHPLCFLASVHLW